MKSLLRSILVNSLALFAASHLIEGLKISQDFVTILIAGVALSLLSFLIKPILQLLTLPINIITLGIFSFIITVVINSIIVYLLTIFVSQITITDFTFRGAAIAGFIIPKLYISPFFTLVITATFLSFVTSLIQWFVKD